jgi:hypothetical protein
VTVNRVAFGWPPYANGQLTGQNDAVLFVALGDDIEKQIGAFSAKRQDPISSIAAILRAVLPG